MRYEYEIEPRLLDIGGGWHLRLLEDGIILSGGEYPLSAFAEAGHRADAEKLAFLTAEQEGVAWITLKLSQ